MLYVGRFCFAKLKRWINKNTSGDSAFFFLVETINQLDREDIYLLGHVARCNVGGDLTKSPKAQFKGTMAVDEGTKWMPWSDITMHYVVDKDRLEGTNQMEK
jgi:hypothetical protein